MISIFLSLMFVSSDVAGTPEYLIFIGGLFTLILAFVLMSRGREEQESSERFRTVRKLSKIGRKKKDS